ncbi:venom metalloprotease inhibitor-like [Ptiloglossa arizonensis]|uniref:venom metalloprotease inhibitor-like n=1 Tax=Ptiloglossa arizonensis TaxID=3350558 RepID=UPI003F9F0567
MLRIFFVVSVALAIFSSTTFAHELVCNKPNEIYSCGSMCQTTCTNLGQPCPIVNIRCNDACYCKEGYARNCRGLCIPISSCPGRGCSLWKKSDWFA